MKKVLLGAAALLLMVSCSGNGDSEKAREDSARIADSIAQVEAAQQEAALASAEQARLDSLRQDSIAQEEKMRLKPKVFRDYFNEKRVKKDLTSIGFKLIKEVYEDYEEFDSYWAQYSRTLNGRTIKVEFGYDTSNGGSIKFYDKNDFEQFKKDLLNSGLKKDEYGFYTHKDPEYPQFEIGNNNTITFGYY